MKQYKVALIGLGRIAWRGFPENQNAETHLKTIQSHPALELVACVDIDADVRAEFTESTGIETWVGTGIPECDIAVVCTPPESHADYIDGLVDRGNIRAILCGHVHELSFQKRAGVHVVSAPTTAWCANPAANRGLMTVTAGAKSLTVRFIPLGDVEGAAESVKTLEW